MGIFDRPKKNVQIKSLEKKSSNNTVFKGYFLFYKCPLCGENYDFGGGGQSIIWIALQCIKKGEAIKQCNSCEQHFKIPETIFADGVLKEFNEVAQEPGDQLFTHVQKKYIENNNQSHILKLNWYDILIQTNKAGPVDVMAMPWSPGKYCPFCGKGPQGGIWFEYACPNCKHRLCVSQDQISQNNGVQVICNFCKKMHFIPPSVWCPKCQQNLLDYYCILRRIADRNGVNLSKVCLNNEIVD